MKPIRYINKIIFVVVGFQMRAYQFGILSNFNLVPLFLFIPKLNQGSAYKLWMDLMISVFIVFLNLFKFWVNIKNIF